MPSQAVATYEGNITDPRPNEVDPLASDLETNACTLLLINYTVLCDDIYV